MHGGEDMKRITLLIIAIVLLASLCAYATPIGAQIKLVQVENSPSPEPNIDQSITSINAQVAQLAAIEYKWNINELRWELTPESRAYAELAFENSGDQAVLAEISCESTGNEFLSVAGFATSPNGIPESPLTITLPAKQTTSVYLLYAPSPPDGEAEFTMDTTITYRLSAAPSAPEASADPAGEAGGTAE